MVFVPMANTEPRGEKFQIRKLFQCCKRKNQYRGTKTVDAFFDFQKHHFQLTKGKETKDKTGKLPVKGKDIIINPPAIIENKNLFLLNFST